jgi:mono/diheme cytochrome c family protein
MKIWKQHRQIGLVIGVLSFVTGAQILAQALAPDGKLSPLPPRATDFLTLPAQPRPPATPVTLGRPTLPAGVLVWDAETKEYNAKAGEPTANFTFNLTNVSPTEVVINSVRTSCGCTVAKLPEQPWHLAPGTNGAIQVTANLAGKFGTVVKTVMVDSSAGFKTLTIKVNIPTPPPQPQVAGEMNRSANTLAAMADRQAVFKGGCAKCHVEPTVAKMGKELYNAGCGICHDAEHRATMVPDLHVPKQPIPGDYSAKWLYWAKWITEGKAGSLMPAFAPAHGGPLNNGQITSLVNYLSTDFPYTNAVPVAVPIPARAGS